MSYEEWLKCLDLLKKKNDQEIKEKLLKEPINENLKPMLEPKIIDLINYKFDKLTENIIKNLYEIFTDNNILDLYLVNYKKGLKFLEELTYIKEIDISNQEILRKKLKDDTYLVYNILIKEANEIDSIGLLSLTIKNNMYKWSDKNEL